MSKLKRRKTALEEIKSEQQFRIRDQTESLRIPDAALHRRAAGSPAGGGSSCWTSSDLSDVEKLWMKTLQALCPEVPARDSALCVPRLPQLSTVRINNTINSSPTNIWKHLTGSSHHGGGVT
ncbi:hypothetical protein PHYPO_G00228360 [Pangasianodon hypophthalmus]|uniref:Uncharacterized protein n=1 Tax=Pangasianodon hypophthalmus TaxID=310915 RepID=A0A5N5NIX4_PANHP|nr:hypothetical protein PHYPO_G00228360 [Pangasianodon hypophthalmus]